MEQVILVNEQDEEIGLLEKMEAHRRGLLHRAFSLFLFNSKGEMLLQQRASSKYHSPNLWTNACCSHPRKNEDIEKAAHRRLKEELNIDCPLKKAFSFIYQAELDHGLTEHEFDHVFIGAYDGTVNAYNPDEVQACRWVQIPALLEETKAHPEKFTIWFLIALEKVVAYHEKNENGSKA